MDAIEMKPTVRYFRNNTRTMEATMNITGHHMTIEAWWRRYTTGSLSLQPAKHLNKRKRFGVVIIDGPRGEMDMAYMSIPNTWDKSCNIEVFDDAYTFEG